MNKKIWLLYALTTMIIWGIWGAYSEVPMKNGFPETLVYCVWAITMILPALVVLRQNKWKVQIDRKSVLYGLIIGFLGAGGQLLLFKAVSIGPTYLIFPVISISPIITILLSIVFLKERTGKIGALGIVLALIAMPLFSISKGSGPEGTGILWFVLAIIVLVAWGLQAYFMKLANKHTDGASIFFYMMLTGFLLVPIALFMTDFSVDINWGLNGLWAAAGTQMLNSVGALCLVFAYRYGKAIVVSPMVNAGGPIITAILSMLLLNVMPDSTKIIAITLAVIAALVLALQPEDEAPKADKK